MTCGKAHCQNAPTDATRVDPAEVEGRPVCDHPGCNRRVVGDGAYCADGHAQGAAPSRPLNQVGEAHTEGMRRGGDGIPAYLEINGQRFPLCRPESGWDEKNARPRRGWGVQVAVEWNPSNRFMLTARTLRQLQRKVTQYPERLVQP